MLTEGMFSVGGDLCDLPGIAKLAARHGARVVLDSAHDAGLLGAGGGAPPSTTAWARRSTCRR
ncbi:hypothetical protein ACFQYP_22830 [Nonomuraea antimicrobica]